MMGKYIVVSPVGNYMGYILEEFLTAVRAFTPPPEKIVLAIHLDHQYNLNDEVFDDVAIVVNPEIFVEDKTPPRIATGRELLRKYFAYSPSDIRYCMSIDTDVICLPETPQVLYNVMEEKSALIVSNGVPLRESGKLAAGPACMLMHRTAATLGKFFRGWYEDPAGCYPSPEYTGSSDSTWSSISSDLMFFSIVDQCSPFLKQRIGRSGRVRGNFIEVKHKWKERRRK
uniref:Glycosyltransferase n=1 Tax=viral metagenome TaxID=1070528 RepID=A0A6M3M5V0_9ZZZZ